MKRSASISPLSTEFDEFLLAPIGEDRNGMLLSVLSALARLDIDPWVEAAKLARLPAESAVRELTSLIAALPDGPSARSNPGTIAARLIALLPRRVGPNICSHKPFTGLRAVTQQPMVTYLIFCVILILVMLVAQWLATVPQASMRVDKPPAPASSPVAPQTLPPSSVQ